MQRTEESYPYNSCLIFIFKFSYRFVLKKGAVKYVVVLNTLSLTYCISFMIFGFNYALENPDMYVIRQKISKLKLPIEKSIATLQNKLEGKYSVLLIMWQFLLLWLLQLIILLLGLLLNVCLT